MLRYLWMLSSLFFMCKYVFGTMTVECLKQVVLVKMFNLRAKNLQLSKNIDRFTIEQNLYLYHAKT